LAGKYSVEGASICWPCGAGKFCRKFLPPHTAAKQESLISVDSTMQGFAGWFMQTSGDWATPPRNRFLAAAIMSVCQRVHRQGSPPTHTHEGD